MRIKVSPGMIGKETTPMPRLSESLYSFRRPAYLVNVRDITRETCMNHSPSVQSRDSQAPRRRSRTSRICAIDTQNYHRRAFILSLFAIFMAEATKIPELQQFRNSYPKAKLPFCGLETEITASSNLPLLVQIIWARFQAVEPEAMETYFRFNLWDRLLADIFFRPRVSVVTELVLNRLHSSYTDLKIDAAVLLRHESLTGWGPIPMLLAECSRDSLPHNSAHKDETKLAVAMGAAMLTIVCLCRHLGEEFVKSLRVYGLLIGAGNVEVVVMYPDFGAARAGPDGDVVRTLALIYRSSRRHWRFSLFGESQTDTDSTAASDFCCPRDEACPADSVPEADLGAIPEDETCILTVSDTLLARGKEAFKLDGKNHDIPMSTDAADAPFPSNPNASSHANAFAVQSTFSQSNVLPDCPRTPGQSRKRPPPVTPEQQVATEPETPTRPGRVIDYRRLPFNPRCINALDRVSDMIDAQAERVLTRLAGNSPPRQSRGFSYFGGLERLMPRGRPTHTTSTPAKARLEQWSNVENGRRATNQNMDSEIPQQSIDMERTSSAGKLPMSYRSLRYWEDEECIWVDVTKTESPYEVAVYAHDLIRESPFFPKLKSCSVGPDGVLKLTLQALLPPLTYIKTFPKYWQTVERKRLTLARLLLDVMGALRTLHAAGFVHSDVSPGNIGFNCNTQMWQLFDFNHSMPIEESLATPRKGGTEDYRSRHTERTGIFRPFDDYIALVNCCFNGFPHCIIDFEPFEPLLPLARAFSDDSDPKNVDIDKCYLMAVKIFLAELYETGRDRFRTDPSFIAAQSICDAINAKAK